MPGYIGEKLFIMSNSNFLRDEKIISFFADRTARVVEPQMGCDCEVVVYSGIVPVCFGVAGNGCAVAYRFAAVGLFRFLPVFAGDAGE